MNFKGVKAISAGAKDKLWNLSQAYVNRTNFTNNSDEEFIEKISEIIVKELSKNKETKYNKP